MYETEIIMVGNVLTPPEWRRTSTSNSLVANFRVASTSRRFDRETGRWVDGHSLRVRVSAWRKLAEGVASSVKVGDPVIVFGRLFTRDWIDEDKKPRLSYEMEALAIGHDLSRGRGRFYRNKPAPTMSVVETPDDDTIARGEPSELVGEADIPIEYGDGLPERLTGDSEPTFDDVVAGIEVEPDEPGPADQPAPEPEPTPPSDPRRSRRGSRREPVPA